MSETQEGKATRPFRAEVSQVLRLVIHSLYSHREIFLRELLSNASDALDRLRFRSLTEEGLLGSDDTLAIRIRVDRDKGLLVIEDTGVGMTEDELVQNLGTVAHSGTRTFLEKLEASKGEKNDLSLIGQFGVGFYSAYLVADRVEVVTHAAGPGQRAVKWSSDARETFTVEPAERAQRGTEVVLHLRDDQKEYLEEWTLRDLVQRWSDYVSWPIQIEVEKNGKREWEQINRASALWQRQKSDITKEQYEELYRHLTHDPEAPLAFSHFRVEGTQEFVGLLYVPKKPPFDLHDPGRRRGVRLFVRRVFIMDDCEDILPSWLRFVRGVVDSNDLPLNVSRELLQDSSVLRSIKKQVSKKTLDLLDELAKDRPDDYSGFWRSFGVVLKEGLALDAEWRERIAPLVRFESTHGEGLVSLADYVSRMKDGQDAVYYLYGETRRALAGSPYLEALAARGYEVLFMTDPVDEWAAEALREFQGKKLVHAMRADMKLEKTDEEKREKERLGEALEPLRERIRKVLGDKVKDVVVSERLTDSPCCLALPAGAASAFTERLLRERGRGRDVAHTKRVFEVNAMHPVVQALVDRVADPAESGSVDEWIEVLYDQALLTEGSTIDDPARFAKRIASLLTQVASQKRASGTT